MITTLEELELTPAELELARQRIEKIAYIKWEEAGCPACDGSEFWSLAEEEWIQREYVPHREHLSATPPGTRPRPR